ncbi:MAG: hypothetical protein WBQ94_26000, partial [Terracidiphilus sp.]
MTTRRLFDDGCQPFRLVRILESPSIYEAVPHLPASKSHAKFSLHARGETSLEAADPWGTLGRG